MRHNNCLTIKLSLCTYSYGKRTNNATCVWTQPYLVTFAATETAPVAG